MHHPIEAPSEFDLLVLCARTRIGERERQQIQALLQRDIHWPFLLQLASDHQVLPLVDHSLRQIASDRVPGGCMDQLQLQSGAILKRNLFQLARLLQVLELAKANDIRAIPYKGPALAALAYGNVGLRRFGDLDFLMSDRHYAEMRKLLVSRGYRQRVDWGWECSLFDPRDGVAMDLHRALGPAKYPVSLDVEALWQRMKPVTVAGQAVRTLRVEDLLIVLCIQLAKDTWGSNPLTLIKICDIAETIRAHTALDWDDVGREATRLGCQKIVWFGAHVAQQWFGAPVSSLPLKPLSAGDYALLAEHLRHKLLRQGAPDYVPLLTPNRFHHLVRERWRDRLYPHWSDLRAAVTPSARDREFIRLPGSLGALYYAVRPVRLLSEWLGGRWRGRARARSEER